MRKLKVSFPTLLFACLSFVSLSPANAVEVAFETDSSLPLVFINVALKAGAVTDPPGQSGITNFMGEMLLRGTQSRNKEQIDIALDQMGAKLEVETRAEALILRGAVIKSQLEPFLSLLSELITQPSFPENETRKLKLELISGLQEEMGHDPTLAGKKFTEFLFRDHPYGKPILGKKKDIEDFTRDQVQAHYRLLFQDQLFLVIGSGDAPSEMISHWANELTKTLPKLNLPSEKVKALEKVSRPSNSDGKRLLIIDKPDRTQTQINLGQIGIRMLDSDFFPLYLGNYAFGGPSFSAILMTEIRVKRGWSYGANSAFRFGREPRSWHIHLFPAAKDSAEALAYSLKLAKDLKESGLTQEKFEFAKKSLVNNSGFMFNTPRKRVENKLLERTLDLPDGFMKSYGPEIQKLKYEQVNDALKRFLQPNQFAIAVLGTAKDLKAALAKAAEIPEKQIQVIPYTEE
jgi:zinc protease